MRASVASAGVAAASSLATNATAAIIGRDVVVTGTSFEGKAYAGSPARSSARTFFVLGDV